MRKLLLSLTLLVSVMIGHAQIVLNELYVDPATNKSHSEFFELYNTSISPTPVNLDCYTLVSYFNVANKKGFYIIDLPNLTINPKSYFVGAAASPFSTQSNSNVVPNFNWNNIGSSGSIKKYTLNTAGNGYNITTLTANEGQDIFPTNSGATNYAVFLFNNSTYVNGFIGGYSSPSVPSEITSMPAITGLTNACNVSPATFSIIWSAVTKNEFVGSASGTDNGYTRSSDGLCGTWRKASSGVDHTPGITNPLTTTSTAASALTTTQKIVCGTRIDFQITAPTTDASSYPVEVQLYIDKNKDGKLDAGDEYKTSYSPNINAGSNITYSFTSLAVLPSNQQYLLVYKTILGCFDKLAVPVAAGGALTTTEKNVCGNKVEFSISGGTGDAASYSLPIQVQLYQDLGAIGTYNAGTDVAIGTAVTISTLPSGVQNITIPDEYKGQNILIVYTAASTCFNKAVVPAATIPGTVTTTQKSICGNRVDFTITSATGDAITYALPVTVELHYDLNNNGVVDAGEETVQASQTVTSFSTALRTLTNPDPTQNIVLVYKTSQNCFSKTATPAAISGALTTTQTNTCGKRIDYAITAGSGEAAIYALPVTVEFRKASDNSLLGSTQVTSFSSTVYSYNVADPQSIVVVYKPAAACLGDKTATPAITTAAIEAGGDIVFGDVNTDGTRTVNYFVQSTSTDAAAFPVQLTVYEDVNKDGVYNTGDKLLGQRTINSLAENGKYTAKITNPNSYAIITAVSMPSGCATTRLAIDNSNAPIENLPVHFASFAASRNMDKVVLTWSTASEQNNRGFNVQRNTGSGWKTVAFVFSVADGGNSSTLLYYAYKETNKEKGITQYRLQQVDMDDKASYSDVRTVAGMTRESKVGIYPNPSDNGNINVVFGEASMRTVLVNDAAGRMVKEYKNVTSNTLAIASLPTGFYTLKVIDLKNGSVAVEKIIIKKR